MARKYAGLPVNVVSDGGGSVRVTIPATPFKVQANAGVSQPCREVLMNCPKGSSRIRVQIGAACTDATGLPVPEESSQDGINNTYLRLPISDVNLLYFIGTNENDYVDILWRN